MAYKRAAEDALEVGGGKKTRTGCSTDDDPLERIPAHVACYHRRLLVGFGQCRSVVTQEIPAPVDTVWSVVRCFDRPQLYKPFVRGCDYSPSESGGLRRVHLASGLPFESTTERLDLLDDHSHVMVYTIVDGDCALKNYTSVTTLHPTDEGRSCIAVESYVVDIALGNSSMETRCMLDMISKCNLQNLVRVARSLS